MQPFDSIRQFALTPARKERMAYFRSVPLKRLAMLLGGAFFLFSAVGFLSSLIGGTATSLAGGFAWAAISGVIAILYILVIARKPALIPVLVVFQIFCMTMLVRLLSSLNHSQPTISLAHAARVYGISALVAITIAYSLFLAFIQTEGRFAFRAQTELALAHSIQKTLVPIIEVVAAGCEIYGISIPSDKVGGDLVDVVSLPDGSAVAYVADIAGHGLHAGILMGMLKAAARTSLRDVPKPEALFRSLNFVLPGVKEDHMYATCAALRLEPRPGGGCDVDYSLAGHPAILHLSVGGKPPCQLSDEQFPLGILPFADYRSQSIVAAAGDLLVAATDGILEVCGKDGVELGIEGLQRIVVANFGLPLGALAEQILAAAKAIGPQDDDRTLLLVRVR